MTVMTFVPITKKQEPFLRTLLKEKVADTDYKEDILLRLEAGEMSKSEAMKEIGFLLKQPKTEAAKNIVIVKETGHYYDESAATVYEVVAAKTGNLYAKMMVPPPPGKKKGKWVYAPGAIKKSASWVLLTLEDAAALGKKWSICAICGATLTDDKTKGPDGLTSMQRGIGPVCAAKF